MRALLSRLTLAASALFFLPWAHAQNADARKEIEAASQAALRRPARPRRSEARRPGRAKLPDNMMFVPRLQADRLMAAYGNGKDPSLLGVVLPKGTRTTG